MVERLGRQMNIAGCLVKIGAEGAAELVRRYFLTGNRVFRVFLHQTVDRADGHAGPVA